MLGYKREHKWGLTFTKLHDDDEFTLVDETCFVGDDVGVAQVAEEHRLKERLFLLLFIELGIHNFLCDKVHFLGVNGRIPVPD